MNRFSYSTGAVAAIFAAGPVFVTIWLAVSELLYRQATSAWAPWHGIIGITLVATVGGAILGSAPIIGGGYIMATLGERRRVSRHPAIWSVAGALLGAAVQFPLLFFAFAWPITAIFAATGAICALIVRYGTRWSDANA